MKPLFGFRALMADLADWIREHRMTLGFVLFITLFNVGMQLVCGIRHTQFPPQLSRVSFDALAHGRWYTAPISLLSVPQLGRLLIDIPLILDRIRLMRNGDWKGEDGMGVADHHAWRHSARYGIMLAVRRQKSAMACDFA